MLPGYERWICRAVRCLPPGVGGRESGVIGDSSFSGSEVGNDRGDGAGDQVEAGGIGRSPFQLILLMWIVAVSTARRPDAKFIGGVIVRVHGGTGVCQHFCMLKIGAIMATEANIIDSFFVVAAGRDWRVFPPDRIAMAPAA